MSRSLAAVVGIVLAALLLAAFAGGAGAPPGATARCRDGSYSYSLHHSGTCSYHGGVAAWLDGSATGPTGSAGAGAAAISAPVLGPTVLLGTRTRTARCRRGNEPDPRCSPGAYDAGLTAQVICAGGFHTSSIRNVTQSEKFAVEREYGMPAAYYGYTIEIDHIVPLELGGSNVIANLFPEPGKGPDDYHAKDRLENRLHDLACQGAIGLRAAQAGIARDWEGFYRNVFGAAPNG